jgi:hypothetical protein
MPTVINAAFIGDSHGMIVHAAAAKNEMTFQTEITSASATFRHAYFDTDETGALKFLMEAGRVDPERHTAAKVNYRINKANIMSASFQSLFNAPLPIFSNIGMSARPFALQMTAQKNASLSRKMMKMAVHEYFSDFHAQYVEITKHCPKVACFYSPTRFTDITCDAWKIYDEVVATSLGDLGVDILDLRAVLGDKNLLLQPEYYPTPEDDGVHANDAWGMKIIDAIQTHEYLQDGSNPL